MITGYLVKRALRFWVNQYAANNNLPFSYANSLYNFLANKFKDDSYAKWFMQHAHEYNFLNRRAHIVTTARVLYVYKDILDLRDWNIQESIAQFWEQPATKWHGMDAIRNPEQFPETMAYQNDIRLWQVDLSVGKTYQDDILVIPKEELDPAFNFNFDPPAPGGTPGGTLPPAPKGIPPGGTPGSTTAPPTEAGILDGLTFETILILGGAALAAYYIMQKKR